MGEREKAGGILLEVADMEQNDVLDVRFVGCKVRTKGSTSTLSLERGDEQWEQNCRKWKSHPCSE